MFHVKCYVEIADFTCVSVFLLRTREVGDWRGQSRFRENREYLRLNERNARTGRVDELSLKILLRKNFLTGSLTARLIRSPKGTLYRWR